MNDVDLLLGIGCFVLGLLMIYIGSNRRFW